jgi:hypothetical protein
MRTRLVIGSDGRRKDFVRGRDGLSLPISRSPDLMKLALAAGQEVSATKEVLR